ncbi:hypothetical protein LCGC14_0755180 [marine sediment metagenome]|uniref:Uncharacterized protein n=1 Tax=marine sediment metagenome TaxID=412755 RepID=A0A0F9Q759_9ZZZZ
MNCKAEHDNIEQQIKDCRDALPSDLPWRIGGYLLGILHTPTKDHRVTFTPGYGVCAISFVTTNGDLGFLVACLPEGTTFTAHEGVDHE